LADWPVDDHDNMPVTSRFHSPNHKIPGSGGARRCCTGRQSSPCGELTNYCIGVAYQ
jgi:hypothetical protein